MQNAEGKMRNDPESNAWNVTAEWWIICGMQKVALSAVEHSFTRGARGVGL